jgi:hypothetical protein
MESNNLTLEVLRQIRDEVRETNVRVDGTNSRVDETNVRLDETNVRLDALKEELSARIVESEVRTATAIAALAGSVGDLVSVLRSERDLRPRVEKCEADIAVLKGRLPDA